MIDQPKTNHTSINHILDSTHQDASTKVTSAIVLAGGRGERLRPLTNERPKPMIELAGYPIIHHSILWLKQAGIKTIVIACGYQHQVIQNYFENVDNMGVDILYSVEEQPLGRGGAIKLASQSLTNVFDPVLVINGDMLTNLSLPDLFYVHEKSVAPLTLVTVPLRSPYGIIETDDSNYVTRFVEKPSLPHWINAGIYLIDPLLWSEFPDVGDHEKILFPRLAEEHKLQAYSFTGFWRTIDTAKDLADLSHEIENQIKVGPSENESACQIIQPNFQPNTINGMHSTGQLV